MEEQMPKMSSEEAWTKSIELAPTNQYLQTRIWLGLTRGVDPMSREIGREIAKARSKGFNFGDTA